MYEVPSVPDNLAQVAVPAVPAVPVFVPVIKAVPFVPVFQATALICTRQFPVAASPPFAACTPSYTFTIPDVPKKATIPELTIADRIALFNLIAMIALPYDAGSVKVA
jgi:hypothetical protein